MAKPKIAISLDKSLLDLVDSKVDGSVIRSRSQAMEFFLKKGLQEQSINTAVLLIKGEHQKNLLKKLKGKTLIKNQLEFFAQHGINNLYIITQHTKNINLLLNEISESNINVEIIEKLGADSLIYGSDQNQNSLCLRVNGNTNINVNEKINLSVQENKYHCFDAKNKIRLN